MKPRFSFNEALSAPFGLLSRRPLCLFVWGLLMVATMVAMYALMIPIFAAIPLGDDSQAAMEAYLEQTAGFSAAMNGMNLLVYLVMLLIWTAVGRATLSPGRGDRFLFLRAGMDEVRVAVAVVATFVGWYVAFLILVLLGVGIGLALWSMSEIAAVVTLLVYGLVVLIASIWLLVRVSLIPPASLILKRFAFVEGWNLARGQVWKLIGLNLVVWLIYMVSMILAYGVVIAILVGAFFGQGLQWPSNIESAADLQPLVRPMILPAVASLIPLSFGFGWIMTLYVAPNIVAARQLLDGAPIAGGVTPADTL